MSGTDFERIPVVGDVIHARPAMVPYVPDDLCPEDFDPYRDEIRDCACDLCDAHAFAMSRTQNFRDLGYRHAWEEPRKTAAAILEALRSGTHQRREEG